MTTKETAMERVQERLETGVDRVKDGLATVDARTRSMIVARPVVSLLCALGLGYVIGRIVSRI